MTTFYYSFLTFFLRKHLFKSIIKTINKANIKKINKTGEKHLLPIFT
jgi:hypothetical protein